MRIGKGAQGERTIGPPRLIFESPVDAEWMSAFGRYGLAEPQQ